jgi:hypothetical protein
MQHARCQYTLQSKRINFYKAKLALEKNCLFFISQNAAQANFRQAHRN